MDNLQHIEEAERATRVKPTIVEPGKSIWLFIIVIFIFISTLYSQTTDSSKNALIKQKIKELEEKRARYEATRDPVQEWASACEKENVRKQKDSIMISKYLSGYQDCIVDTLIPDNKCAKLLFTVAVLSCDMERDAYVFKMGEIGYKKRMHAKNSTIIIPSEPKFDFPKAMYYYNLIIVKYPAFERLNQVYIELYKIAQLLQNDSLQKMYRDSIIVKFPEDAIRRCMMPPVVPDGCGHCIQNNPQLDLLRKADKYLRDGYERKAKKIYKAFLSRCQTDTSVIPQLCIYAGDQLKRMAKKKK